jgi:hypothetical protein
VPVSSAENGTDRAKLWIAFRVKSVTMKPFERLQKKVKPSKRLQTLETVEIIVMDNV